MNEEEFFEEAMRKNQPIEKIVTYQGKEYLVIGSRHPFAIHHSPGQNRHDDWQWKLYREVERPHRRWFRHSIMRKEWVPYMENSGYVPRSLKEFKQGCINVIEHYYTSIERARDRILGVQASMEIIDAWDGNLD